MASDGIQAQVDVDGALPSGRFLGRLAFEELILNAFQHAASKGWSEMILSDSDFSDWPLNRNVVIDALSAWALAGRKLTLLANRYDEVHRGQPRFTVWRRNWGHLIEARVCDEPTRGDVPSAIWSPSWFLHRTDPIHQSGCSGSDRVMSTHLKEMLAERLRTSAAGFPASVLGL